LAKIIEEEITSHCIDMVRSCLCKHSLSSEASIFYAISIFWHITLSVQIIFFKEALFIYPLFPRLLLLTTMASQDIVIIVMCIMEYGKLKFYYVLLLIDNIDVQQLEKSGDITLIQFEIYFTRYNFRTKLTINK
jgi:hypothetical protein